MLETRRETWRGPIVGATAFALLGLTACSADSEAAPSAAASDPVYGVPADPDMPNPTDVATDPAVTVGPTADGSVRLTYAEWDAATTAVVAGAILPGVVESDGTCTLTLTKDGASAEGSVPANPDASSMSCGGLSVAGAALSSGTWTAVVTYRSSASSGSSEPTQVVVP